VGVVESTAVVPGPPEQVAAYVTDPAKVVELSPDVEAFELSGPLAVGTKVREVRRVLGRRMELEWTVTEYEPNRRMVFTWSGKRMRITGAVTFEPIDGRTRISTRNEIHSTGAVRLVEGLIAKAIRREEQTMFDRLRARLER
jgi:carbon monoxide dehydrogenase subunit G